jgi:aminoglycoside phosphotransferase (APT) family kinase protein
MSVVGKVATALLAALIVVALAVAVWKGGWWVERESTNKRTAIANDSLARQQSLLDESVDTLADIRAIDAQVQFATPEQAKPLRAQRAALVTKFCKAAGGFTTRLTIPDAVSGFASEEC